VSSYACHVLLSSFYHVRPIIFEKTIITNFIVQMKCESPARIEHGSFDVRGLMERPLGYSVLQQQQIVVRSKNSLTINFEGFLPRQYFLSRCVPRDVGTGGQCGVIPFPFRTSIFFSIHAKPHFFSRSRPSCDSRCEPCIVLKKVVNVFCLQIKIL